jgi:hypothetical protein
VNTDDIPATPHGNVRLDRHRAAAANLISHAADLLAFSDGAEDAVALLRLVIKTLRLTSAEEAAASWLCTKLSQTADLPAVLDELPWHELLQRLAHCDQENAKPHGGFTF